MELIDFSCTKIEIKAQKTFRKVLVLVGHWFLA